MRILPSVTHLLPLDSNLGKSAPPSFCQTKGISGDVQPIHGGPRTIRRQDWTSPGNEHWRDKFACDTSSALEWFGLFTCAALVVHVSFYNSCCTKTQRKIYNLQNPTSCVQIVT
ncbi:hypothetical protein EV363DRAFT_1181965 [Boletus edulis]|nr:hypothetical protein EV363DRAFT_1181965 [Boletus edulis]